MKDVLSEISRWRHRGDRIAIATVIDVKRSVPRAPGSKMAVSETGEIAGGVSGGCVEGAVVELAEQVLAGAPPQLVHFGIADSEAWDVGLPCGGEIDVWIQAYATGRLEQVARGDGRAAEVTLLEGASPGAKLLIEADGARSGSLGTSELDAEGTRAARELLWSDTSERRGPLFVAPRRLRRACRPGGDDRCRPAAAARRAPVVRRLR